MSMTMEEILKAKKAIANCPACNDMGYYKRRLDGRVIECNECFIHLPEKK